MFLLRMLAIVVAAVIGAAIVAWLVTGRRQYLAFAARVGKYALLFALLLFSLLAAERLLTLAL